LISREDVKRLTTKRNNIWNEVTDAEGRGLDEILESLPSIDAVPVVRCKDCLFNDGDGPNEDDKYWCALHQSFMQYCSDAERKEE